MEIPITKKWIDKKELAQVVGHNSCLVIKEKGKIISACNKNGAIKVKESKCQ